MRTIDKLLIFVLIAGIIGFGGYFYLQSNPDALKQNILGGIFKEKEPEAYAVYSEADYSLSFYKRTDIPKPGSEFEGKIVTDVYEGIEGYDILVYSKHLYNDVAPWVDEHHEDIRKVEFVDKITPVITDRWFAHLTELSEITFNENFDTSNVTSMLGMFEDSGLKQIKFSESFDTSNVCNMQCMFHRCKVRKLELPNSFNTSNVVDMEYMFKDCRHLTYIDFGDNFNTVNVENMDFMFGSCDSLSELTLPESFDTSNVLDMSCMFIWCDNLLRVNFPKAFTTKNVLDISFMFDSSCNLTMDCSDWDVSKVTKHDCFSRSCKNVIEPKWVN